MVFFGFFYFKKINSELSSNLPIRLNKIRNKVQKHVQDIASLKFWYENINKIILFRFLKGQ